MNPKVLRGRRMSGARVVDLDQKATGYSGEETGDNVERKGLELWQISIPTCVLSNHVTMGTSPLRNGGSDASSYECHEGFTVIHIKH